MSRGLIRNTPVLLSAVVTLLAMPGCSMGTSCKTMCPAEVNPSDDVSAGEADPLASQSIARTHRPSDLTLTVDELELLSFVPDQQLIQVMEALLRAGDNKPEIIAVLDNLSFKYWESAIFLIANMSDPDLKSLSSEFLIENIMLAHDAWENSPWGEQVTQEHFLQYILPYATFDERRDSWRADFYAQLREECWKFDDPIDATNWLNDHLNDQFRVYFDAVKRAKPDQSPYESIEVGYASCTGLSILLTDACRAVGIPARIVGVLQWKQVRGNHNWVEVFGDRWYNVGGTNSDTRDDDWVNDRCLTQTDPDSWRHAVYAACYAPTATHFPLIWDMNIRSVPAKNVTRFYSEPVEATIPVPSLGPAEVRVYWADELVARKQVRAGESEVAFRLGGSMSYRVVIIDEDGTEHESQLDL